MPLTFKYFAIAYSTMGCQMTDAEGVLHITNLLQTPHPLGFNENIYHEGNISRLPDLMCFFLF